MIQEHTVLLAFGASLVTWLFTALGAAVVLFFKKENARAQTLMLGFAAGVMLAASFWSLLQPAIALAQAAGGLPAFCVVALGFLSGVLFLWGCDRLIFLTRKKTAKTHRLSRTALLILSITLHNIPEGLAVGVAFGALRGNGFSPEALLGAATVAFGIAIQNFPEGAAVSLPLRREGLSRGRSFLLGQASGIVEPQSLAALVDTIEVECRQKAAAGANTLVLTPGHYGEDFLAAHPVPWPVVTCSNFIGDALDICASLGFERVLLVGHVGKLCKLAAGMNTHSRTADARAEVFVTHAALAGAPLPLLQALMEAPTTDGCLDLLDQAGLTAPVLHGMLARMGFYLTRRAAGKFTVGAAMFSQSRGLLGCTPGLQENFKEWNPDE